MHHIFLLSGARHRGDGSRMVWISFVSSILFDFINYLDGSHDYISNIHANNHGKKIKTFKEWNSQGYGRIVQEMIGYANYVDRQRKEEVEDDVPHISEPVNFENGPGGLPLLPAEVKGVRGSETTKHAQEIIRSYFLRHYRKLYNVLHDSIQ
jgi:hypothetical protein